LSQTSVIFFGLLVGFVVFITVKGELQAYLAVLGLAAGAGQLSGSVTGGIDAGRITVNI
jgi:hypothetical protein